MELGQHDFVVDVFPTRDDVRVSDDMRIVLQKGTDAIIKCIEQCIEKGQVDGSIQAETPAVVLAQALYQLWLGASLLAKLNKMTPHSKPL